MNLHKDLESLYEHIPRDCLPEDMGGTCPSIETLHKETVESLYENRDFFIWHDSQKVDESKRLGKAKTVEDIFGKNSCVIS